MTDEFDPQQVDQELEQLDEQSEEHFQNGRLRSAMQVAKDATRQSRAQGRAIHYMRGLFDQMRFGHGLLEPQTTADAAVELIALLNDEERARLIQPDLNEGHYHWVCQWMSSCAYDNLAEATGDMNGYNSQGMHECIADGIQVCRQTGKLECVKCFREYASDVYLAADDLDMVLHHCEVLREFRNDNSDSKDRRWTGHRKQAWIKLLRGDLLGAKQELEKAASFTDEESVYLKLHARLHVAASMDEALLMLGEPRVGRELLQSAVKGNEWPQFELEADRVKALEFVVNGDVANGIELLTQWDQRLRQQRCLKEWFEIRLRLIAAYLIDGNRKRAEAIARGLEASAAESQDFLTLRRLKQLMESAELPLPIPTLEPAQAGRNLAVGESSDIQSFAGAATSAEQPKRSKIEEEEEQPTPLQDEINDLMNRILQVRQSEDMEGVEGNMQELLEQILQFEPEGIESPKDAAMLLMMCRWVVTGPDEARQSWEYGKQLAERFPEDATMLNVFAELGAHFRSVDADVFSDISEEFLEETFRNSLRLDPERPRNYLRAGDYFVSRENLGEAERCYSRAFRLDRTDGTAAISLSNLYGETDRPRDALAALDLSLREGCSDPDVAWEAALAAYQLEQYDAQLTYLDKHLELSEPHAWVEYYRAWALLELERYDECLAAIERERQFELPGDFQLKVLTACAHAEMLKLEEASSEIHGLLADRLADVEYLSLNGLVRILSRLCAAVADWPRNDPARMALMQRMLETGLMPDAYFEELRANTSEQNGINFYRVQIRQPLGTEWSTKSGCLPGQTEWTTYCQEWGVLAATEDEAVNFVLETQYSGLDEPAEVVQVIQAGEGYDDRPGVVWQGFRWSEDEADALGLLDLLDEEDSDSEEE
ncbi:MAG: tetratricopeptide repeat protein [Planctomycetaceae bacterium]